MGVIETGYVHRLESSDCNIIRFPVVAPRECAGQEKQRALIFVVPVRCSATQYLNNPYTKEPVCPHISVLRVLRDDKKDPVFFKIHYWSSISQNNRVRYIKKTKTQ